LREGVAEEGFEGVGAREFAEGEAATDVESECFGYALVAGETFCLGSFSRNVGGCGRFEFGAEAALGLQSGKVFGGAAEVVAGVGAGPVD
jgi:hypothetical protein